MKRTYVTPDFEVEQYQLNASIAANCQNTITMGPGNEYHQTCDKDFPPLPPDDFSIFAMPGMPQMSFYDDDGSCECTYSSGGEGYFTS